MSNAFRIKRNVADADVNPCSPFTSYTGALDDSAVLYALLSVLPLLWPLVQFSGMCQIRIDSETMVQRVLLYLFRISGT
jgi:hypothetical protein